MSEVMRTTFGRLVEQGVLDIGDGYRAKLEELGGTGPLFLRAGSLGDEGFVWTGNDRFHAAALSKIKGKVGRPGDVVITTKGNSTGRTGYVAAGAPEFVYSPHLSYWRCLDGEVLLSRFLRYWAKSAEFTDQLRSMAHGTDMAPYLSLSDQRHLEISIPLRETQEAIADVLGALDDKIVVNKRIARTCEELAVVIAGEARWLASTSLGAIVSHIREQVVPSEVAAELVAHYSIPAFDADRHPEVVPPETIKSAKFKVSGTAVLLSKLNPSTPRVWNVVPGDSVLALASTEFLVLKPAENLTAAEVWAVCNQPAFTQELSGKVTGTSNSHQRVKPSDLLASKVVDPRSLPAEDRRRISSLCDRAWLARQETSILMNLRDTLLPKLMSGEIRVREAEKVVEEAT